MTDLIVELRKSISITENEAEYLDSISEKLSWCEEATLRAILARLNNKK